VDIVFAISEVEELVKTGGLADVGKALPLALQALDENISIIMPYYKAIKEQLDLPENEEVHTLFTEGKVYHFKLKHLQWHGIPVYFIDAPDFFMRDGLYSDAYDAFSDNGERFSFFSGAVLHALKVLSLKPQIIHCHDWHTAMLPFLLSNEKTDYFINTKTVFTIHNAAFQGVHKLDTIPFLRYHPDIGSQVHGGYINMLQSGIEFATKVTTVSPNYATELITDLCSHGLHERLVKRKNDLSGILNGCDYTQWNPETDSFLPENYTVDNLHAKQTCKKVLQQKSDLPENVSVPLIGMVCRLTEQKGFSYLLPILDDLIAHNIQMVIVGTGDPKVCMDLGEFAQQHPTQFAFINGFSSEHAHLVEAGADFFLMPSQFEPCGLNQMYSLAYGTIPIVRSVGGLKDTVVDTSDNSLRTGFVFDEPSPAALLSCIRRALLSFYEDKDAFRAMQIRGMKTRFTWHTAAQNYQSLYSSMLN
jgi:starch synthase